jgi:hypothetical protein
MPASAGPQGSSERASVIGAVKTYLSFYVLVVLVVETALGALALKATGTVQLLAICGMLAILGAVIAVVTLFAYRKPEVLLRSGESRRRIEDFSRSISGEWWEHIRPATPSALSFVVIRLDAATGGVRMSGTAYTKKGTVSARWHSVASCVSPDGGKVFYYWEGSHRTGSGEKYGGFGELRFDDSDELTDSGDGSFWDANLVDVVSTTNKSVELHRASTEEAQLMKKGDVKLIADLVREKLDY